MNIGPVRRAVLKPRSPHSEVYTLTTNSIFISFSTTHPHASERKTRPYQPSCLPGQRGVWARTLALVREVFFLQNMWPLTQRLSTGRVQRVRDSGVLSPKWEAHIAPLAIQLGVCVEVGTGKVVRAGGGGWLHGNCFPAGAGQMHRWTHGNYHSMHEAGANPSQTRFQHGEGGGPRGPPLAEAISIW